MNDLISREQALNTIRDEMAKVIATIPAENTFIRASKINPLFRANKSIRQAIRELPSAEKTGTWMWDEDYSFRFEDDAVYVFIPCPEIGEQFVKSQLVITKEIFIACYEKWIKNSQENE